VFPILFRLYWRIKNATEDTPVAFKIGLAFIACLPKSRGHHPRLRHLYDLPMQPFGIARKLGKTLIVKLFNSDTRKVMTYKYYPLPEIIFVTYFPLFDKFTRRP
jgi:hypothetical protein